MILSNEFIFMDKGISGKKAEKRPDFMKMISMAKQKPAPFDVILVWKFSRFARNQEESIVYKNLLRNKCKVDVVSITEQPVMICSENSLSASSNGWMNFIPYV